MAGTALKRRMQNTKHLRTCRKPFGDPPAGPVDFTHAHLKRPHATKRQKHFLRSRLVAYREDRLTNLLVHWRLGGDDPQHAVRMTGEIFRPGSDDDIDAQRQWLAIDRCRPGRIDHRDRTVFPRCLRDGWNIWHLKSSGSRCLEHDRFGFRCDQVRDPGPDHGIEIRDLDPLLCQEPVTEGSCVSIDIVGYQQSVAMPDQGHQGCGNRSHTGRR